MPVVTGDRYLESLVKFVDTHAERLIDSSLELKLNPVGLRYVQSRLEALEEVESLLVGAPVDYLRAYISDLGDHRALEQLRKILRLLPSLKVVSVLPPPGRDPTPLTLVPFASLKVLELRGCDLSSSTAKGLLSLRFTLEKLICYNSTDSLRHVFTSRIADVKDSPQWNQLSFVSCTCNGLVLMDDSLQLLPIVESLDLSRNKFTKVDNLNKCTKLKLVDLGYNSLKSIASFTEISCQVVKLVLRNNALISLHGVENLKSLQGLDLSYNIISSFSEIERLSGLQSLQRLLLEGNPVCYARWFRPKVFSLFTHPEQLKLDEKKISPGESWKRKIIIASRKKHPASFGFYSPAVNDVDVEGSMNTNRKHASRLACIEHIEQIDSDQDLLSYDNETKGGDKSIDVNLGDDAEDLKKLFEFMKKDDPWLKEFKQVMDQKSEDLVVGNISLHSRLQNCQEYPSTSTQASEKLTKASRCKPDFRMSVDDIGTSDHESMVSLACTSTATDVHLNSDKIGEVASELFLSNGVGHNSVSKCFSGNHQKLRLPDDKGSSDALDLDIHSAAFSKEDDGGPEIAISLSTAINGIIGYQPPSASLGSPPHYQEDMLLRRNSFEEEYLKHSANSLSLESSDTDTSCSIDGFEESGTSEGSADFPVADDSYAKNAVLASYLDDARNVYHETDRASSSHCTEGNCSIPTAWHAPAFSGGNNFIRYIEGNPI